MKNKIFNEDCIVTMNKMVKFNQKIDVILTSPPYNTGRPSNSERSRENREGRYDVHIDNLSTDNYCKWVVNLFNHFDKVRTSSC
jgi:DNA modification methylase